MASNRSVYLIYLALCAALTVYFIFFSRPTSATQGSDADALSALLAGGGAPAAADDAQSIFDTEFYRGAQLQNPIPDEGDVANDSNEEPEILDPADPNNPINPVTGQRYPDSAMRVFDRLRERFPNNSLLPKRESPEDKQAGDQSRMRILGTHGLIARGEATPEQVNEFYDFQAKGAQDRVELIRYVMEEKGDQMSADVREQYTKLLTMSEDQLKGIEAQRESALNRNRR